MKFNKDSKIIRVSAYAEGYYSNATAYGELYIPYEYYILNKERLEELEVSVGELDGKHSEVSCDIDFEELTIADILTIENELYEEDEDIDESVFDRFCVILKLNNKQRKVVNYFSNELLGLDKILETEDISFKISKDTVIDEMLVPKGTIIKFTRNTNNKILDYWSWEFDFNI